MILQAGQRVKSQLLQTKNVCFKINSNRKYREYRGRSGVNGTLLFKGQIMCATIRFGNRICHELPTKQHDIQISYTVTSATHNSFQCILYGKTSKCDGGIYKVLQNAMYHEREILNTSKENAGPVCLYTPRHLPHRRPAGFNSLSG